MAAPTVASPPSAFYLSPPCSSPLPSPHRPPKLSCSFQGKIRFTAELTVGRQSEKEPNRTGLEEGAKSTSMSRLAQHLTRSVLNSVNGFVDSLVETIFRPNEDLNFYFNGNFAPVQELDGKVAVKVLSGSIPSDFPIGVYLRTGPNPQHGGYGVTSPFGDVVLHWFEGDGMLHATYFEEGGNISYRNKYIETDEYKLEKQRKKRLWLPVGEGSPFATSFTALINQVRFGKTYKHSCNTAVQQHAGKVFACAENHLPYELDVSDLSVKGVYDCNGHWKRAFTSHAKLVRDTNEWVVHGWSLEEPYFVVGIISADGQHLSHEVDVGINRTIFSHEVAITKKYNLILDFPLTMSYERLKEGRPLLDFERHTRARIGVMPRYGDASSIRWFDVEMSFTYHIVNSYDDGDEVILHGCRAREPLYASKRGIDHKEWLSRGVTYTPIEKAQDPVVDGALYSHLHEWRFNLQKGTVVERDLKDESFSMDMPKINETYVGYKYKYAYGDVLDINSSKLAGMPMFGKLVKLTMPQNESDLCENIQFHDPGPGRFVSEPLFVPKPSGIEEDDGWILTYVHDEIASASEMYIIDAQNFSGEPIARIELPQRVPYGFHSNFLYTK